MIWSGRQVREESLNIVMEHVLYPKGEGKQFKTSKQKNSIIRSELLKGLSVWKEGLEQRKGRWKAEDYSVVRQVRIEGGLRVDVGRRLKRCLEANNQ